MTWLETMIKKHGSREAVNKVMAERGSKGGKLSTRTFATIPKDELQKISKKAGQLSGKSRRERRSK